MYAEKLVLNDDTEEEKDKGTCTVNIFQLRIVQKNYKSYLYVHMHGQTKNWCDCDLVAQGACSTKTPDGK